MDYIRFSGIGHRNLINCAIYVVSRTYIHVEKVHSVKSKVNVKNHYRRLTKRLVSCKRKKRCNNLITYALLKLCAINKTMVCCSREYKMAIAKPICLRKFCSGER